MKTFKVNLKDQVSRLATNDGNSGTSEINIEDKAAATSPAEYKNEIKKLKEQIEMLEDSLQNAREEAFQAGIEEGKEQAKLEINKIKKKYKEEYKSFIESINDKLEQALKEAASPLLELAYKIAEKIIDRELRYKQDYSQFLEEQLNKHITDIIDKGRLTIQLHPTRLPDITKENLNKELSSQNKIHIIENSELGPGDCVIETSDIKIDARISRQLENLKFQNNNIK